MSCGMQRFSSLGKQTVPLGGFEITSYIEEAGFTCKRGKPSFIVPYAAGKQTAAGRGLLKCLQLSKGFSEA